MIYIYIYIYGGGNVGRVTGSVAREIRFFSVPIENILILTFTVPDVILDLSIG